MSVAFICPLHSNPYLITAFVVNKYEQSAKNGNKEPIKCCKQCDGRKLHFSTDRRTERERGEEGSKIYQTEELQSFFL